MTMKVRASGALQTISSVKIMQSGVLRNIKTIKIQDGGVLRTAGQFVSSLSASASPATVAIAAQSSTLTTNTTTVAPSGGRGPYSYSWALTSSSGGINPTINNTSFATASFTKTGATQGELFTATFSCTVTDGAGQTAIASVSATFFNIEDFS